VLERAQLLAEQSIAAVRGPSNTNLHVINGSGLGKWGVREGWAGPEWGLEGLVWLF